MSSSTLIYEFSTCQRSLGYDIIYTMQSLVDIMRPFHRTTGWVLNPAKSMPKRGGTKRVYRYDPKKVWLRVMKEVVAAGGKAITMYGMRHSFASNFLIAGVSDVKVSRWLGHSDTRMVHRHYGHLLSYDGDINAVTAKKPANIE